MLIGLTGGIASGKSTVARRLAELGAVVVDADVLAREVVAPGTPGLAKVVERFGPGVLAADGSLDRAALGALVFDDPQARRDLEAITHPEVRRLSAQAIDAAREADPDGVFVYDIPLLVEADRVREWDAIVVVDAPAEERVRRLVGLRGMDEEQAWRRVRSQATDEQRLAVADVVIDASGTVEHTLEQVDALWARIAAGDRLRGNRRTVMQLEDREAARVELGAGLRALPLGFGAMALTPAYGGVDPEEGLATLNAAVDLGIELIDTADAYAGGENERLIGRLLADRREEVLVATKFGIVGNPQANRSGTSAVDNRPEYIRSAIRGSLQRLGTDHVDVYYMHRRDVSVPIEDAIGTMGELVDEGLVRWIGVSELTAQELRDAAAVRPIAVIQSEWSVWTRDIERQVVPTAAELGIGVVPYSPLGRGFLAGGIDASSPLPEGDFRRTLPRFQDEARNENARVAALVAAVAEELDATPAQVALAWLYAAGERLGVPVAPIPGTRRAQRVAENLGALRLSLSLEQLERLDVAAALTVGDRFGDLGWVSQGRESAG